MKTILVSFASERFFRSQHFLVDSAKKYVSGYINYTPNNLDKTFIEKNKKIFSFNRGYGYWLWKPFIIQETLKMINDNDIVFYVDSGNTFSNNPLPVIEIAKSDSKGLVLFKNRDDTRIDKEIKGGVWPNYMWTKYDCFAKMNCNTDKYINGNQINGSYMLVRKTKFTKDFFEEYISFCQDEDIITDSSNKLGDNYSGFREHRHDQSICSLLSIKHDITILEDPSQFGNHARIKTSKFNQIFNHHRGII